MSNETIAVFVIMGVALLDATLFAANCLRFRKQKALAKSQALELAQNCKKVLKGVEPDLAKQVEFSTSVEIHKLGRLPWQRRIYLILGVNKVPVHKTGSLTMPITEGVNKYLNLPAHLHLRARIEINATESALEKRHVLV